LTENGIDGDVAGRIRGKGKPLTKGQPDLVYVTSSNIDEDVPDYMRTE